MSPGFCGRPRLGVSSCLLGEEPLSVPIALLAHYALGLPWLAEQTYLQPFPASLRLRHSV